MSNILNRSDQCPVCGANKMIRIRSQEGRHKSGYPDVLAEIRHDEHVVDVWCQGCGITFDEGSTDTQLAGANYSD